MTDKKLPFYITQESFQGLCAKYGFTQQEKGTRELLNDQLEEMAKKLMKQATLHAEHDRHSGLKQQHAQKAIEMTPEIPKGIY